MKKILYVVSLFFSIGWSSCNYLDVVPENDIRSIETIFERKSSVETWLKGAYVMFSDHISSIMIDPAFCGADEVVGGDYIRQRYTSQNRFQAYGFLIGDGLQNVQNPYGDVWKNDEFYAILRYCNIFFENIHRTYNLTPEEKRLWTGEMEALKAHVYFELLRRYGPFILVPENLPANSDMEVMQQPRAPIDSCVSAIVRLCDDAMDKLPPLVEKGNLRKAFHAKEAAATIKAMALLYAASPLFNGNSYMTNFVNKDGVKLFPEYDHEKWRVAAEAIDEAIEICRQGGIDLISGNQKSTELRSVMADIEASTIAKGFENQEAIFMVRIQGENAHNWHCYTLPKVESTDEYYHAYIDGCISPSLKMVEMYYTEHGVPIDEDRQWMAAPYSMSRETDARYNTVVPMGTDVLSLHLRREPRFYAHIAADRLYWNRTKSDYVFGQQEDNILMEAYRDERFGIKLARIDPTVAQNLSGYWLKKGTDSSIPFGEYPDTYYNGSYGCVIFRLADLYLASAEAWNEYLDAPTDKVYGPVDKIRERAGLNDVQTAYDNYAINPEKAHTKAGMREIIHREWDIEFAFEGRRFWNLRRWMIAEQELNQPLYGWNVLGTNADQFYNYYNGPVIVWSKRQFVAPRDYFSLCGDKCTKIC